MDMHFPTDLLVYVGKSNDYVFNTNTIPMCPWCDIPFVVAMSIADPTFKWTLAAVKWND
jgi:predicted nucleic acid-binding Zn finger protein